MSWDDRDIAEKIVDKQSNYVLAAKGNQGGLYYSFGEDKSQKWAGYTAQNFSLINKIEPNLTKNYEDKKGARKGSVKTKRLKCGWDNDYLLKIFTQPPAKL